MSRAQDFVRLYLAIVALLVAADLLVGDVLWGLVEVVVDRVRVR